LSDIEEKIEEELTELIDTDSQQVQRNTDNNYHHEIIFLPIPQKLEIIMSFL
jgi:hypothetical protein